MNIDETPAPNEIDFDANSITIKHTVATARVDGKAIEVVGDTTKSYSSMHTLPLVPAFRAKLMQVKQEQEMASLLSAAGVSVKQNQEWLGHSDFAITAKYCAHLEYESKVAAANAMA